jgi:glycosyltransferase involved in cell wall biosynthesis
VRVVPIGISDIASEAVADTTARIRGQAGGRKIVFALGRMTHYKGFDVLIRAAAGLPADTVVMIGGGGGLLASCQTLVRQLGLDGRVHLLGPVPDHELASHFAACDIFCMSSTLRAEAYGVAMLEAMMMGKPVVATDIAGSGVPWVNEHGITGLNVRAGDAAALSGALTTLLADEPSRLRLGRQARERYLRSFSAQRMVEQTRAVYEDVLAR